MPTPVAAASVVIDDNASATQAEFTLSGAASVFIDDQTGYKFFVDANGTCSYSKTVNGGDSWGAAVIFDVQTDCSAPVIWYDQWTPGDAGTFIHIGTLDPGSDDLWYNRLDTTDDSLLLGWFPVNITESLGYAASLAAADNNLAITKGTDGTIYMGVGDGSDSIIVECTSACDAAGNWSEVGITPLDNQTDPILLLPQPDGDIMLLRRDRSLQDVQYQIWDNSSWDGPAGWSTIDGAAAVNGTYDVMMAATLDEDFNVYLAYIVAAGYITADHDLRIAYYNSATESWTNKPDIITDDTRGLTNVAIMLDANTKEVYVAYSARAVIGTPSSASVYFATSTAAMATWGAEQGPLNAVSDDIYGVDMNVRSNQRIYVSWYEDATRDVVGEVLADVSPKTIVSKRGTMISTLRASSSPVYIGGAFVFEEFETSRTVTSIRLTESGTVDAAVGVGDISLYYDIDTSFPYDCASEIYDGTESQYGSTDTNGFSAADGVSLFSDIVTISPTESLCVYPVLEVTKNAADATTLILEISNPAIDVGLSGGVSAVPKSAVVLSGTLTIEDDVLTQTHFHFRNNDGTEGVATSRTGGVQDVALSALQTETPIRLRFGVSNEGSTTSFPTSLRLEYAPINGTCNAATSWIDIDAVDDAWNLSPTGFITDGLDATDIAESIGGVSNENSSFISSNNGLRDISSTLGALTFSPIHWTEAEFSIIASSSATEGETYCFRLSDAGNPLSDYSTYPRVTLSSDASVQATGTQVASADIPKNNFYTGGTFIVTENANARNVTSITLTEQGTIDATVGLNNIKLLYDLDTSFPYDCASEIYDGTESQYGSTDTNGFSAADGVAVFTDSVGISTTTTLCVYPVVDITTSAVNGETIDVVIESGLADVVVDGGGSVGPATTLDIDGSTTLNGGILSQTHYHWRQDNGNELTASSSVAGSQDTQLTELILGERARLRLGINNIGPTTSVPTNLRLEYGVKIMSCEAVSVWTDVAAAADAWNMYDSAYLTNAEDATNIATTTGGVDDPAGAVFFSGNGGVRDTESEAKNITLKSTEFTELEFSITSTATTSYDTTYCFRVTNSGTPLLQYDTYAELRTAPKRDFRVQQGTSIITSNTLTLMAGADYINLISDNAFVRITNMHHTGAGRSVPDNLQEADDETVYVSDASDLTTSFTFARNSANLDTVVSWEIIEFIGDASTDNEMIVHTRATANLLSGSLTATGTTIAGVADDSDVVVYITGIANANATANAYFNGQVTSRWNANTNEPIFERGAGTANVQVSYAVVEYTGINWKVQRSEHAYSAAGVTEVESVAPINSLTNAFIHAQKRMPAYINQVHFGHEVWLSSIGAVSFRLSPGASAAGQVSVAWVIENTQTSAGKMKVQRRSASIIGGVEPRTTAVKLITPVSATNNTSVFAMSAFEQNTNNYVRVLGGVTLVSTSTVEIYNSDILSTIPYYYRIEAVEWPTTGLSLRQNYYRFYTNNDALDPVDPWPIGASNLGENTTITALDEPIAEGEVLRLRISLSVGNATLPAGSRVFKLQYGERASSCVTVETWTDVGAAGSGEIWRLYNTEASDGTSLSGDPPTFGDLNLSVADVAGNLVESFPSSANQYAVDDGQDIEYDFPVEHNGALGSTFYCFRVVDADGTLLDGYTYYPQLRTAGFTPVVDRWRWYDDDFNLTPTVPLAVEQVAPSDVANQNSIVLRLSIAELKHVAGNNANVALQYSEYADFSQAFDVTATSTCAADSLWCYADGVGVDHAPIMDTVIPGVDACLDGVGDGCGLYIESNRIVLGDTHAPGATREYSFTIVNSGARVGAVYYFRVYDLANSQPIVASSTYPSVVAEGPEITSTLGGVASGTVVAGISTDVNTTPTAINFGSVPPGVSYEAVHQLTINTNATEGYQLLMYATQQLTNEYGEIIAPIGASNTSPGGWSVHCPVTTSCFGYHTTDATLRNASARFAPIDSYAAFATYPEEVMHSSIPVSETHDIVYRIQVAGGQPAGDYETNIVYISVPVF